MTLHPTPYIAHSTKRIQRTGDLRRREGTGGAAIITVALSELWPDKRDMPSIIGFPECRAHLVQVAIASAYLTVFVVSRGLSGINGCTTGALPTRWGCYCRPTPWHSPLIHWSGRFHVKQTEPVRRERRLQFMLLLSK